MKSKLPVLMGVGILILIVVVGVMVRTLLMQSEVAEQARPVRAPRPVATAPEAEPVAETVIAVGDETPAPSQPVPEVAVPTIPPPAKTTPAPDAAAPAVPAGTVKSVRGYCYAAGAAGQMRPLREGGRVYVGERVQTARAASLKIEFPDGTILSQGENAVMIMDEYVFNPDQKADCRFGMRFIKGACHIVTGMITRINPDRFLIRTRLASMGVRGCEVAMRSQAERVDIHVLSLSGRESVRVDTTRDGSLMLGEAKREVITVDAGKERSIEVTTSGRVVTIMKGRGAETREATVEERERVVREARDLLGATHNARQTQDGAIFTIKSNPKQTDPGGK